MDLVAAAAQAMRLVVAAEAEAADRMHPVAAVRRAEEDLTAAVDRRLVVEELRRAAEDRTISARRG
jgi:hypothetical protein